MSAREEPHAAPPARLSVVDRGAAAPDEVQPAWLVPGDLCRAFGFVPLGMSGGRVIVAVADQTDRTARHVAEQAVRRQTTHPVAFVLLPRSEITARLDAIDPPRPEAPAAAPASARKGSLRRPLGELLLDAGLVTQDELDIALEEQRRSGSRLGAVLAYAATVTEDQIAQALALQLGLEKVDVGLRRPEPAALELITPDLARRHHVLPLTVDEEAMTVASADPLDDEAIGALSRAAGRPLRLVIATETGIDRAVQRLHAEGDVRASVHRLLEERPEDSAFHVLSQPQKVAGALILLLVAVALVLAPITVAVVFIGGSTIFYALTSLYRFRLIEAGLTHHLEAPVTAEDVAALDDRTLPVYTILLPMYREAEVVPKLLRSLTRLDYPATKLDIKLLIEADDDETREAVESLGLPPQFRLVVVPDALPKTKPKACNYGLMQARGELVVIYDAEDEPEPDQLKKVVAAFAKLDDPSVACVQCKLNYFNRDQNLLTAWFTTEYSMWFDLLMPGLDASDAPIPLGGTSNHFLTDDLVALGAWDPYNVAEDADLGIRLSRAGRRTAVVDSTTYEEATSDVHNWIRQRSRWVKGYMQTWLVHMRHPVRLMRELGPRRFLSFQLVVGGTFVTFLLNPVFWALSTLWTLTEADVIHSLFPGYLYYASGFALVVGNFVFAYLNAAGAVHRGDHRLVKYALLSPVYWCLMSIAAWKGAIQLITRPHYWEKTLHGQDTVRSGEGAA